VKVRCLHITVSIRGITGNNMWYKWLDSLYMFMM